MSLPCLHRDFETRSALNLKKVGLYRYFEDASTGVWVLRWRAGEGPVHEWMPGDPDPDELLDLTSRGARSVAHNEAFEREAWEWLRRNGYGHWPALTREQEDCTMARAAALGMPQALDDVAKLLGLSVRKDKEGQALMMKMAKPLGACLTCQGSGWEPKAETDMDIGSYPCPDCGGSGLRWRDDMVSVERLSAYCEQDVEVETGVDKRLPPLTATERQVWELDQAINDRGVAFDTVFSRRAAALCAEATERANREMWRLTGGAVEKVSQVARIVSWLNAQGVGCSSLAKGEADDVIASARTVGHANAEAVVRLRRAAAKSSTAKYESINGYVCADGRVRGLLNYHGAHTGRWAGRGPQPQNFPRLSDENRALVPLVLEQVAAGRDAARTLDAIELLTDQDALSVLSWMLRPTIIAGPGRKLVGGDYSNIEGRINAWLAGEAWKVEAFRAFDAGVGDDLYRLAYARSFGGDPGLVSKAERQIGKVLELSMGYQGGVGAFQNMAANYGVRVSDERADELKKAWRAAHPRIVESWWELDDAVIGAIMSPGLIVPAYNGAVQFVMHQGMLLCRLPSGRCLHYHQPSVRRVEIKDRETGEGTGRFKRAAFVWGQDSTTKQWVEYSLYGGLTCENIVQGVARDIMVDDMLVAEAEGFPLVLTVHDELLTEPGATSLVHAEDTLNEILAAPKKNLRGLPLAAGTWEDERYVK